MFLFLILNHSMRNKIATKCSIILALNLITVNVIRLDAIKFILFVNFTETSNKLYQIYREKKHFIKRSSLLRIFLNYGRKESYSIKPMSKYNKTY